MLDLENLQVLDLYHLANFFDILKPHVIFDLDAFKVPNPHYIAIVFDLGKSKYLKEKILKSKLKAIKNCIMIY
jgi:hypothetical protein